MGKADQSITVANFVYVFDGYHSARDAGFEMVTNQNWVAYNAWAKYYWFRGRVCGEWCYLLPIYLYEAWIVARDEAIADIQSDASPGAKYDSGTLKAAEARIEETFSRQMIALRTNEEARDNYIAMILLKSEFRKEKRVT